jgi:hypothetical protein
MTQAKNKGGGGQQMVIEPWRNGYGEKTYNDKNTAEDGSFDIISWQTVLHPNPVFTSPRGAMARKRPLKTQLLNICIMNFSSGNSDLK